MEHIEIPRRMIRRSRDGNEGARKGLGCTNRSCRMDGYARSGKTYVNVKLARTAPPIFDMGADATDSVWTDRRAEDVAREIEDAYIEATYGPDAERWDGPYWNICEGKWEW